MSQISNVEKTKAGSLSVWMVIRSDGETGKWHIKKQISFWMENERKHIEGYKRWKRKYYVRIRCYKIIDGQKHFGSYRTRKAVRVK